MNFSSNLLENAVNEISQLPGIGKRTALRLVLFLLRQPKSQTHNISKSLTNLVDKITHCESCYNICENKICDICLSPKRNKNIICVVEDIRDVMAIETTAQFSEPIDTKNSRIHKILNFNCNSYESVTKRN